MKNKLESVMARLNKLRSGEKHQDGVWDENEQERREKLFEWVVGINPYPQSH